MEFRINNTFLKKKENLIIIGIALFNFLFILLYSASSSYGYFRDELYYIACSKHLAWGYVDHPPFSIFVLWLWRLLFGESIISIRLIPALSMSATILIITSIVRQLLTPSPLERAGVRLQNLPLDRAGARFPIIFSAIAAAFTSLFQIINSFYSMNTLELLIGTICTYILVRIFKYDNRKLWMLFGMFFGIGLLNKHTFIIYGICLLIWLIFTQARKYLKTKELWLGILIAFIILLPNLIWQFQNGFPSLEFYRNAATMKYTPSNPLQILFLQAFTISPFVFIISIIGCIFLIFNKAMKDFKVLGWMYIFGLLLMIITRTGRPDRIVFFYPILIAAGSVLLTNFLGNRKLSVLKYIYIFLIIIGGSITHLIGLPVLTPQKLIVFNDIIGFHPEFEKGMKLPIIQPIADRLGWEELADSLNSACMKLKSEQKSKCVIVARNYGEAGAIELLGKKYKLPSVVCGHNSYWLWKDTTLKPDYFIIIRRNIKDLLESFENVEQIGKIHAKYAIEDNAGIFLCSKPRKSMKQLWEGLKFFI